MTPFSSQNNLDLESKDSLLVVNEQVEQPQEAYEEVHPLEQEVREEEIVENHHQQSEDVVDLQQNGSVIEHDVAEVIHA